VHHGAGRGSAFEAAQFERVAQRSKRRVRGPEDAHVFVRGGKYQWQAEGANVDEAKEKPLRGHDSCNKLQTVRASMTKRNNFDSGRTQTLFDPAHTLHSPRLKSLSLRLQLWIHTTSNTELVDLAALTGRVAGGAGISAHHRCATVALQQKGRLCGARRPKPRLSYCCCWGSSLLGGRYYICTGRAWQRQEVALVARATALMTGVSAAEGGPVTCKALRVGDQAPPLTRVAAPACTRGFPKGCEV